MVKYLKNVGLEEFDNEEGFDTLIKYSLDKGYIITGYSGNPYINTHCGSAEIIIPTQKNEETEKYDLIGFNTHATGNAVWKIRIREELNTEKKNGMEKSLLIGKADSDSGLTVVNVVNADVWPSFLEDDIYNLQMVAFAEDIDYFENEDAYNRSLPKDDLGRRFGIGEGCVFPAGFLKSRTDEESRKKRVVLDEYTIVRGTVTGFQTGKIQFLDEEESQAFIYCNVETEYGKLQIIHTYDQIKESQKDNLKAGSTVVAICYLSGDAAIYEYEKGIVRDEEHHLRAIRNAIMNGNASRLKSILADNVIYISDNSNATYDGCDNVIDRLTYVHNVTEHKYYSYMATISGVKEEGTTYEIGKRCVVLATDNPNNYDSILFIECNEKEDVIKLHISADSRYTFHIDESPYESTEYLPEFTSGMKDYEHAMYMRGEYMTFLDGNEEEFFNTSNEEFVNDLNNIKLILGDRNSREPITDENLKNISGYLFAKSIEVTYAKTKLVKVFSDIQYSADNAWNGEYDSVFDGELLQKLKTAMKHGRNFGIDFINHVEKEDAYYREELLNALVLVQRFGRQCALEYMERVVSTLTIEETNDK